MVSLYFDILLFVYVFVFSFILYRKVQRKKSKNDVEHIAETYGKEFEKKASDIARRINIIVDRGHSTERNFNTMRKEYVQQVKLGTEIEKRLEYYVRKAEQYHKQEEDFTNVYLTAKKTRSDLEERINTSSQYLNNLDKKIVELNTNLVLFTDADNESAKRMSRFQNQVRQLLQSANEEFSLLVENMGQTKDNFISSFQTNFQNYFESESKNMMSSFSEKLQNRYAKYNQKVEDSNTQFLINEEEAESKKQIFENRVNQVLEQFRHMEEKAEGKFKDIVQTRGNAIYTLMKKTEEEIQQKFNNFVLEQNEMMNNIRMDCSSIGETIDSIRTNNTKKLEELHEYHTEIRDLHTHEDQKLQESIDERKNLLDSVEQRCNELEKRVEKNFASEIDDRVALLGKMWQEREEEIQNSLVQYHSDFESFINTVENELKDHASKMKENGNEQISKICQDFAEQVSLALSEGDVKRLTEDVKQSHLSKLDQYFVELEDFRTQQTSRLKDAEEETSSLYENHQIFMKQAHQKIELSKQDYEEAVKVQYSMVEDLNKKKETLLYSSEQVVEKFQQEQELILKAYSNDLDTAQSDFKKKLKKQHIDTIQERDAVLMDLKKESKEQLQKNHLMFKNLKKDQEESFAIQKTDLQVLKIECQKELDNYHANLEKLQKGQKLILEEYKEKTLQLAEEHETLVRENQLSHDMYKKDYKQELDSIKNELIDEQEKMFEESLKSFQSKHDSDFATFQEQYLNLLKNLDNEAKHIKTVLNEKKQMIEAGFEKLTLAVEKKEGKFIKTYNELQNDHDKFRTLIDEDYRITERLESNYLNLSVKLEKQHTDTAVVDEKQKQNQHLLKQLESNKKDIHAVSQQLQTIKSQSQHFKQILKDQQKIEKKIDNIDSKAEKMDELTQKLTTYRTRIEEVQTLINQSSEDKNNLIAFQDTLDKRRQWYEKIFDSINDTSQNVESLEKKTLELDTRYEHFSGKISELKDEFYIIKQLNDSVKSIKKEVPKIKTFIGKIEKTEKHFLKLENTMQTTNEDIEKQLKWLGGLQLNKKNGRELLGPRKNVSELSQEEKKEFISELHYKHKWPKETIAAQLSLSVDFVELILDQAVIH